MNDKEDRLNKAIADLARAGSAVNEIFKENGEAIVVNINLERESESRKRRGTIHYSDAVQAFSVTIREMIRKRVYPFDIDVVATKDVMDLEAFGDASSNAIGRALHLAGAVSGGQVRDGAGMPTRIWVVRDRSLAKAPKSRLEYIFQRREKTA